MPPSSQPRTLRTVGTRKVVTVTEAMRAATPSVMTRAVSPERTGAQSADLGSDPDEWGSLVIVPEAPPRALPFVAPAGPLRPARVITSGFERLDFSVASMIERLPEAPLESKFNTVAEWIDKFRIDLAPSRVGRCLTAILDAAEAERTVRSHAVLSHLEIMQTSAALAARSIASCFATHQLLLLLCRVQPVLTPICQRVMGTLLAAVYPSPPNSLPTELLDRDDDPDMVKQAMLPFKGRMYFQASRDASKRLTALEQFVLDHHAAAARQKRVVQRAVVHWQGASLRMILKAWRQHVATVKEERQLAIERQQHDALVQRLTAEITALKLKNSDLEARLRDSAHEERASRKKFEDIITKMEYDAQQAQRQISSRDALIDELEEAVGKEKEARANDARLADAKYRELGTTVAAVVNFETSRLGRNRLRPCRRDVLKVAQNITAAEVATGDSTPLLEWVKKQLNDIDPTEQLPRPPQLVATGQVMDVFAAVAAKILPHVAGAHHLLRVREATALSAKAVAIANWCAETKFMTAEGFNAEVLLRNTRESTAAICELFSQLMTTVLCPREAFPPVVMCGDDHTTAVVEAPAENNRPWGPNDIQEVLKHCFDEYATAVDAAFHLQRASANRAIVTIAAIVAGGEKAEQLTTDEKTDQSAFYVNHQILGDASISREDADAVQKVVEQNYRRLRAIFLSYTGDEGVAAAGTASMTALDFYRLLGDCRALVPNVIDRNFITNSYAHSTLDPRRFIAALVTVARLKYPNEDSAASAFKVFLEVNLLAFAETLDVAWAPIQTKKDTALSGLLTEYRQDLFKIFRAYCTDANQANKIPKPGYLSLLRDCGILTATSSDFTEAMASKIFNFSRNTIAEDGIAFDNFINALAWCASHVYRDPFVRISAKLKRLVFNRLLPGFRSKFKLSYVPLDQV